MFPSQRDQSLHTNFRSTENTTNVLKLFPSYKCFLWYEASSLVYASILFIQLCWTCQCSPVQRRCWVSVRRQTHHPVVYLSGSTSSRDERPTTPRQTDLCLLLLTKYQVTNRILQRSFRNNPDAQNIKRCQSSLF